MTTRRHALPSGALLYRKLGDAAPHCLLLPRETCEDGRRSTVCSPELSQGLESNTPAAPVSTALGRFASPARGSGAASARLAPPTPAARDLHLACQRQPFASTCVHREKVDVRKRTLLTPVAEPHDCHGSREVHMLMQSWRRLAKTQRHRQSAELCTTSQSLPVLDAVAVWRPS